jgi:hypothetical protein
MYRMPKALRNLPQRHILVIVVLLILSGCAYGAENGVNVQAAPTMNPAFDSPTKLTQTVTITIATDPPPATSESVQSLETAVSTPVAPASRQGPLTWVTIYNETLRENWTLENSWDVNYDDQSTSAAYLGSKAISFTPIADFGSLFFSIQPGIQQPVRRDQTLGVSFWIYSDEGYIQNSDIAVTVLGSNKVPYWMPDDHSVTSVIQPVFSETRLYYLDINRDIPPGTWVQVRLWLDERVYDPDYQYVTGFYIKTDKGFRNTVQIDQVELISIVPLAVSPTP